MVDFENVYLYSDQPTTCPKCGSRTDIIMDLSHSTDQTQVHKCLAHECEYEFVIQSE
jgi:hypothetical protein